MKRMVANAKQFNVKGSTIYEDAERIRKTASNWMVKNNPAYRDPGYSAQPTPIPGELNGAVRSGAGSAFGTPTPQVARGGPVRLNITHKAKSATPAPPPKKEAPEERTDFVGKSFGEAQDLLMQEMIDYAPDAEYVLYQVQPPLGTDKGLGASRFSTFSRLSRRAVLPTTTK